MKGTLLYEDGSFNEVESLENSLTGKNRLFSMKTVDFVEMLQRVEFAASRDDTRYYIQSVAMEVHPDRIITIATDGRRFSMCQKACECAVDEPTIWTIAIEQIPRIIDIVKEWDNVIMFDVHEDGEVYLDNSYYITAQLAMTDHFAKKNEYISLAHHTGEYPQWRKILPVSQPYNVTVGCYELLSKLEAMFEDVTKSNVGFEHRNIVLEFKDDKLAISTESTLIKAAEDNDQAQIDKRPALQSIISGEAKWIDEVEMPISDFTMAISLNAHFLIEALKSIRLHHYIDIGLADWRSPMIIRKAKGMSDDGLMEDEPYLHLIMPLRSDDVEAFEYNNDDERLYFDAEEAA